MGQRPLGLRPGAGLAVVFGSSLLAQAAIAAPPADRPSGALDRLTPAPAGDALFTVPSADVPGATRLSGALLLSYAHAPLALRRVPASGQSQGGAGELAWVERQLVLHTLISVELARRIKFEFDVPATLEQRGTSGTLGDVTAVSVAGGSINDVRFGARVLVLRQDGYAPAASVALSAWLPTGDPGAFTGSGVPRFEPEVIVGATYARWLWALSIGRRFQPRGAPMDLVGSQTTAGLGVAARFGALQVGPELSLSAGEPSEVWSRVSATVSGEALLGARYALGPFTVGVGGGPGLGRAPGTPSFRLFAALGYAGELGQTRATSAGAARAPSAQSAQSAQPAQPAAEAPARAAAAARAGAPGNTEVEIPSDRDGDQVPDAEDACPSLVGDARPGILRRGCPKDGDGDGIIDLDDRCPDAPGVISDDAAKNGCPADSDGDGIADAKDACPSERGKLTEDPKTSGCPEAVRVEGAQIVIFQPVNFETGRDEIKPESFALLEQVAGVLKEHPELVRVAVDGHTDNKGRPDVNLDLSRRRAVSVVRWLTDHGIDARRLEARGFGARQPLADNATEAGRAKNRRVEFLIRRRSAEGEAGWKDGPLD